MNKCSTILLFLILALMQSCTRIPEQVIPIHNFELDRYLGTWYEIARLDHSFQRGLQQVTADYSMRNDGGVKVINRGFNSEKQEWNEATGRAYFVGEPNVGQLKVSFFGPFYGGYNIIALDSNYEYVMICGANESYLWILARSSELDTDILHALIAKAKSLGFATEQLIYVKHN